MKRLGDVLAMLSSVLLGTLVRDFDNLASNLRWLFYSCNQHFACDKFAKLTILVLIAVFVRNIHGSVCYEKAITKSAPSFLESSNLGRCVTFVMALGALFLGPSLAGHDIENHTIETSHAGSAIIHSVVISPLEFSIVLFMPFGIYFVWDLLMWISRTEEKDDWLNHVVNRWTKIDAAIILLCLTLGVIELHGRSGRYPFNYEAIALAFVMTAFCVTLLDYVMNRSFYFPAE